MSRFEEALGEEPHRTLLKEIFNQQIRTLGEVVADLGKDTAGDATRSPRGATEATAKAEMAEASRNRVAVVKNTPRTMVP